MEQLAQDLQKAWITALAVAAGIGLAVGITATALAMARSGAGEGPARQFVPCIEAGLIPPQDRSAEPRVLPCPPPGTSARNPVLVETGVGPIRLAFFEGGEWLDAADPTRPIYTVWSWRWP